MARLIFELTINLIETFLMLDFITRYFEGDYKNKKTLTAFIITWLITFFELSIINSISVMEGIAIFIPIAIYFAYSLLFLKGNIWLKLWISCLIEIIVFVIAIGTNLVVCSVIGYDPYDMITVFNAVRIISVIITKIILFYITRIILKVRYKNPIDKYLWLMLIFVPVISVFSLSALMIAAINHDELTAYILTGMSGILFADGITYYFFVYVNKEYETKLKLKILEMQNENAKRELENSTVFVEQMKKVRHDFKNQLMIISDYIQSQIPQKALGYISELNNDYMPNIKKYINTGNNAFDAVINSKITLCNQKNIYLIIKEMKNSSKNLNSLDTVVLFGNLLDNAIEASEKTTEKRISLDIRYEGEYLSILVSNSIETSVLTENGNLETSKKDKELHGIGIKTIKEIVKKYDGMIQFYEEEKEFCCHILLKT